MADKWLDQHIEKELEGEKRPQLRKILNEGFINSGKSAGHLSIYEKDDERIFYDSYNDRVRCRFDIKDLMSKL